MPIEANKAAQKQGADAALRRIFNLIDIDAELRAAIAAWMDRTEQLQAQGISARDAGLQAARESGNARLITAVEALLS